MVMKTTLILLLATTALSANPQSVTRRLLDLQGSYTASMPCTDCRGMGTTLKLDCKSPCKTGTYSLTDVDGTAEATINNVAGKWTTEERNNELYIILNYTNASKASYYFVKKDGNLQPLDKTMQPMEMPVDITMRKQ